MSNETLNTIDFSDYYDTDNTRFILGNEEDNHFAEITTGETYLWRAGRDENNVAIFHSFPFCLNKHEQYSGDEPLLIKDANHKELFANYTIPIHEYATLNDLIIFLEKNFNTQDVQPNKDFIKNGLKTILTEVFDDIEEFDISSQQEMKEWREVFVAYTNNDPVSSFLINKIMMDVCENKISNIDNQVSFILDKIDNLEQYIPDLSYSNIKKLNEEINIQEILNEPFTIENGKKHKLK